MVSPTEENKMAKKTKRPAQRKVRRANNRRLEVAKRALAHSTPNFDPREAWSSRKKVNGVPHGTLMHKQHQYDHYWW